MNVYKVGTDFSFPNSHVCGEQSGAAMDDIHEFRKRFPELTGGNEDAQIFHADENASYCVQVPDRILELKNKASAGRKKWKDRITPKSCQQ